MKANTTPNKLAEKALAEKAKAEAKAKAIAEKEALKAFKVIRKRRKPFFLLQKVKTTDPGGSRAPWRHFVKLFTNICFK